MTKILHLIPTFGDGGAERQLSLLAPALAERGFECHVAYGAGGQNFDTLVGSGVSLHALPARNNHDPRILFDLVSLIRAVKPQIVQTWLLQMDVLGGIAAHMCGIPHILSERASRDAYPDDWKNRWRIRIGRRARAIVANSGAGLDYWISLGARRRSLVIPNAVVTAQDEAPEESDRITGENPILFAGRLCDQKNLPNLLEGLDLALAKLPDHSGLLFGDGPLSGSVRAQIDRAAHRDRIFVQGFTRHLPYWLRTARLAVSVSHFEGQPNFVLEAANIGCPLILSDIGEHRELLPEAAAWYVDRLSPQAISDAIVQAASDRRMAQAKAMLARQSVEKFSLPAMVTAYAGLYREILAADGVPDVQMI